MEYIKIVYLVFAGVTKLICPPTPNIQLWINGIQIFFFRDTYILATHAEKRKKIILRHILKKSYFENLVVSNPFI